MFEDDLTFDMSQCQLQLNVKHTNDCTLSYRGDLGGRRASLYYCWSSCKHSCVLPAKDFANRSDFALIACLSLQLAGKDLDHFKVFKAVHGKQRPRESEWMMRWAIR